VAVSHVLENSFGRQKLRIKTVMLDIGRDAFVQADDSLFEWLKITLCSFEHGIKIKAEH
jgi:hypothetical protein